MEPPPADLFIKACKMAVHVSWKTISRNILLPLLLRCSTRCFKRPHVGKLDHKLPTRSARSGPCTPSPCNTLPLRP